MAKIYNRIRCSYKDYQNLKSLQEYWENVYSKGRVDVFLHKIYNLENKTPMSVKKNYDVNFERLFDHFFDLLFAIYIPSKC